MLESAPGLPEATCRTSAYITGMCWSSFSYTNWPIAIGRVYILQVLHHYSPQPIILQPCSSWKNDCIRTGLSTFHPVSISFICTLTFPIRLINSWITVCIFYLCNQRLQIQLSQLAHWVTNAPSSFRLTVAEICLMLLSYMCCIHLCTPECGNTFPLLMSCVHWKV